MISLLISAFATGDCTIGNNPVKSIYLFTSILSSIYMLNDAEILRRIFSFTF